MSELVQAVLESKERTDLRDFIDLLRREDLIAISSGMIFSTPFLRFAKIRKKIRIMRETQH